MAQPAIYTPGAPAIWITTHGLYAGGALIGYWLNPGDGLDKEEIFGTLREMAAAAKYPGDIGEELMICDHEEWAGLDPAGFPIGDLEELAALIEEDEEKVGLIVEMHGSHYYSTVEDLRNAVEELSYTEGCSESDVCDTYCEEIGVLNSIPEHLRYYFDCEAYVRDVILNGDGAMIHRGGSVYLVLSA